MDDSVKKVKLCPEDTDTEDQEDEETAIRRAYPDEGQKVRLEDITVQKDTLEDYKFANDEYTPYRTSQNRNRNRRNYDFSDDEDEDEGTMKSLEKYRPSFYEVGPPKESGDINDIRDYYTNMLTRQRAMTRFTGYGNQQSYNPDPNHGEYENGNGMASAGYGDYDPYPEPGFQPRGHTRTTQYQPPALDESTRYLLDKAKAARSRPVWEPEEPTFDHRAAQPEDQSWQSLRPPPPKEVQPRAPEETMMSSRTRSLLDQVKQSTAALQTMSLEDEEDYPRNNHNPGRRPSRFLRRSEDQQAGHRSGYSNDSAAFDVSRMADEILGESMYPRDEGNRMGRFSSSSGISSAPRRKHSYQSSLDTDRFSDRSSPESRVVTTQRSTRMLKDEDDDLDAMINSLKQKTSGRDMAKVVYDIEGDESGRTYGRKSVSPIPKRDYSFDPMPETRPRQQARPGQQPPASFDPYNHLRGGSGYAEQGYQRPAQFGYRQQPQPPQAPPMDPYGYPPPMGYAYGPPRQPPMQQQPMYQGFYPAPNASASGRRPSYGYYD